MTSMDECRNCGERIYYEQEEIGGYWFHPATELVWCYGHDPESSPHTWHLQAEPKRPPVSV